MTFLWKIKREYDLLFKQDFDTMLNYESQQNAKHLQNTTFFGIDEMGGETQLQIAWGSFIYD